jgi:hypothetical protein
MPDVKKPEVKKPPADDRLDAQEARLGRIEAALRSGAVPAADPEAEAQAQAELEAFRAEIAKGPARLTQEAADCMFPGGAHRWRCTLPDGNGHPELVIGADTKTDAKARYMAVCGIRSCETDVAVQRA